MFEYRQKRHVDLEAAIRLFAFNGECDDFDKWLQDKAKQLNQDNEGDTVEAAKLNFEVLPVFFIFFIDLFSRYIATTMYSLVTGTTV